jgi:hypothetical protein
MTVFPDSLEEVAENSDYMDVEHLYTVMPAVVIAAGFALQIGPLVELAATLDTIDELRKSATAALKGILGGAIGLFLYSTEDSLFFSNGEARTKEQALLVVLGTIVGVGVAVDWVAPAIIDELSYDVLQVSALLLIGGMYYLHHLVAEWRLENELPHLCAGLLIFVAPYLPAWIG